MKDNVVTMKQNEPTEELLSDEECWEFCDELGITNALIWMKGKIDAGECPECVYNEWIELFNLNCRDHLNIDVHIEDIGEIHEVH